MKVTKTYSIEIRSMIFSLSEEEFFQLREVVNSVSPELKFEKPDNKECQGLHLHRVPDGTTKMQLEHIMKDPYAELKKAYAEGKTIQLRSPGSNQWRDQDGASITWMFSLENYRIKPEEPKSEEWIPWDGGECPVDPNTYVEVKFSGSQSRQPYAARSLYWECDTEARITAYRII